MCWGSYRILSFGSGGTPKFSVDVEGHVLPDFFFFLIDALRLILGVLVVSSKKGIYLGCEGKRRGGK